MSLSTGDGDTQLQPPVSVESEEARPQPAASDGGATSATAGSSGSAGGVVEDYDDYGYHFYPHRSGTGSKEDESWLWRIWHGRKAAANMVCQQNVVWCVENNPMVRLLHSALKKSGCAFKLSRHVSCEPCLAAVNGGYDPMNNQVVVCENNATSKTTCCNVLAHEMIHAFDFCRAKVDFKNIEHVACTEVRAAALMHCSFKTAISQGLASPIHIKQRHQDCVKLKALNSVVAVRNVSAGEAAAVVDKVFTKCYADLEPVGRIPRKKSSDPRRAYVEASLYGYAD